ncbi:MAG TPA: ATP-binding protein [Pedobacter sp.]|uniref:PAS domain-containing sensor histidine kinase n=1 Tax=Pedobacter sp. TaxID=1411316 RepID=UPI002BA0121E|nr:ATP-binding protein [Pedobacter sp.]HMI02631.1 ATP-binding protein [Pedobacter sp.]
MKDKRSHTELLAELQKLSTELQAKEIELEEATDIIDAIRNGEVDALVMKSGQGHQLFTLKSADQTYRIFIEQMTEGAVTLNSSGNILYANSQFGTLLNTLLEKITGHTFVNFVAEADRSYFESLFERSWQHNSKGELSLSGIHGNLVPVQLSLNILSLDEGMSMSIILTDLTEQKESQRLLYQKNIELEAAHALTRKFNLHLEETVKLRTKDLENSIYQKTLVERELRSNQEQLSRVLETMAEGVTIIDFGGNVIYANPMAKKILGLKDEENIRNIYNDARWTNVTLDGDVLPADKHPVAITLSEEQPMHDYEIGIQPANGERFYISINAAPIRDENGEIISGIATFMDVTHRRKVFEQKDEFISVASHELKTPITSLKASLQLLRRLNTGAESELFHKLMEQANKSMNRVSVLIEDLLNTSKFTGGQLHLNKNKINLYELIAGCCDELRLEDQYCITMRGDKTLNVEIDAYKIEQVLINLINNAIKYASESLEILINVERFGALAKVAVIDKGPGIPPEVVPHLFDRYYRVDPAGRQYSGLGLGLYISSEIIKKHGGQIGVESEPGSGSTFWFTLPCAPQ